MRSDGLEGNSRDPRGASCPVPTGQFLGVAMWEVGGELSKSECERSRMRHEHHKEKHLDMYEYLENRNDV